MASFYDFTAETLDGKPAPLSDWKGKVVLVVNTASKCGFTPQFAGLEELYKTYGDKGFIVLGFPCNHFGAQEPGNPEEIANFCALTYDVDFPMMQKIDVNGPAAHPLYVWLKREKKGLMGSESIKWNFSKFLVDRSGKVVGRFGPADTPQSLKGAIEAVL